MGGALIQLVAYGAQDIYLTGQPQITFFKSVYRRHTNFSHESIRQGSVSGTHKFGTRIEIPIQRMGDMLGAIWIELVVPTLQQEQSPINPTDPVSSWHGYCNSFMHAAIKSYELWIGGQLIDRQFGDWLEIWSELTVSESRRAGYFDMIGKYATDTALQYNAIPENGWNYRRFRVPLQFWFCRHVGYSLPLIGLQYHDVKLVVELRDAEELTRSDQNIGIPRDYGGNIWQPKSFEVWCDYYFLDAEERRRYAQQPHEYLIEQVQFNGEVDIPNGIDTHNIHLSFNHPVKELIWTVPTIDPAHCKNQKDGNDHFRYSSPGDMSGGPDTFERAVILMNGTERFMERDSTYFRNAVAFAYHTRTPTKNIYCYSFALKPEDIQPSGTCNFSRIDSSILKLKFSNDEVCMPAINKRIRIYAHSYNVLRIMSGMGGLAYST